MSSTLKEKFRFKKGERGKEREGRKRKKERERLTSDESMGMFLPDTFDEKYFSSLEPGETQFPQPSHQQTDTSFNILNSNLNFKF